MVDWSMPQRRGPAYLVCGFRLQFGEDVLGFRLSSERHGSDG
jgi:hypothetical protein